MRTATAHPAPLESSRVWWAVGIPAVLVSLYALAYVVLGERMYPDPLLESFRARPWGIYPHALFGGIAMFTGALQFRRSLLVKRRLLHRRAGITYVACAVITGMVGIYMSIYSFGGWITHVGFGLLGTLLVATTLLAFGAIRRWDVASHRAWMLRSYALLFAAVTLRFELPLLVAAFAGDFAPAYQIVSWLCWVPNLAWAEWYLKRSAAREAPFIAMLEQS